MLLNSAMINCPMNKSNYQSLRQAPAVTTNKLATMNANATLFSRTITGIISLIFLAVSASAQAPAESPAGGCYWLELDGTNSYVSVPDATNLNFDDGNFTAVAWFRAGTSDSEQVILQKGGDGTPGFKVFLDETYKLGAAIDDGASNNEVLSPLAYAVDEWHHVAVTFDRGGFLALYVDGSLVNALDISGVAGSVNNTAPLTLGAGLDMMTPSGFLHGRLDDVALWSVLLTETEISEISDVSKSPLQIANGQRVAFWPFEDGIGISVVDYSEDNDGTIIGTGYAWEDRLPSGTIAWASLPASICEGDGKMLTATVDAPAMSTYMWNAVPDSAGITASFVDPTSTTPGLLTVSGVPDGYTATIQVWLNIVEPSPSLCNFNTNTLTLTVYPDPAVQTIQVSAGGATPCTGRSYQYSITGTTGSNYIWSVSPAGNHTFALSGPQVSINWGTTVGTYQVMVRDSSQNGCTTDMTSSVTMQTTPVVTALPDMMTACPGSSVPFVNLGSTPTGSRFDWTVTGQSTGATSGTDSTSPFQIPGFTAVNPGATARNSTTSVTATLNGCVSDPVTFSVTVSAAPDLQPIVNPSICRSQSFNLSSLYTAVDTSDANDLSGNVTVHTATPATSANLLVGANTTVSPPTSTVYYFRKMATDGPGCSDELPVTLNVQGPITINSFGFVANQDTICEKSSTAIEVNASNGGSGALMYQWQMNTGTGWMDITPGYFFALEANDARLVLNNVPLSFNGASFRCQVSSELCDPINSPSDTLHVTPGPILAQTTMTPVSCHGGNNGGYAFQIPTGVSYTYSFNPGMEYTGPPVPSTPAATSNSLSPLPADDYILRLYSNGNECFIDTIFTITEPEPLSFSTSVTMPSCHGFSNGVIHLDGEGGSGAYQFSLGTGAYQPVDSFPNLLAGSYQIRMRDAADTTCLTGPQTVVVTQPAELVLMPDLSDLTCFEAADGSIVPNASGGVPPYSFTWSANNGFSGTYTRSLYQNNFDNNLNGFVANPAVSGFVDANVPPRPGNFAVNEYWSQSTNNDRALTFYKTAQGNSLYWDLTLVNTTGAPLTEITLTYDFEVPWVNVGASSPRTASLLWQVNDGAAQQSPVITNAGVGTNTQVWLRDGQMDSLNLAIRNLNHVFAGLNIAPDSSFTIRVTAASSDASQINMNHGFDNLTIIASAFNGTLTELDAGIYSLTLTDNTGCTQTAANMTLEQPGELSVALQDSAQICISNNGFNIPFNPLSLTGDPDQFLISNLSGDAGDLNFVQTNFSSMPAESPFEVGLQFVPMETGWYNLVLNLRNTSGSVPCVSEDFPVALYVSNPETTIALAQDTLCSGGSASFALSIEDDSVPTSIRWTYQHEGEPENGPFFATFDAAGMQSISQVLTNDTDAPRMTVFTFRAYTYGPDGEDNEGDPSSDDCVEENTQVFNVLVWPQPTGTLAAVPVSDTICTFRSSMVMVNTSINPAGSTRFNWTSTNGGGGMSVPFGTTVSESNLVNTGNDYSTVTYTFTPYTFGSNGVDNGATGDDCPGEPVQVDISIEPLANATGTPQRDTICGGTAARINVSTTLLIENTRYRWRYKDATDDVWSLFTDTVSFDSIIEQVLPNTGMTIKSYVFEIQPFTFGPDGTDNFLDNCFGQTDSVVVHVLPQPVLDVPVDYFVCSTQPLNYRLPDLSSNDFSILSYQMFEREYYVDLDGNWSTAFVAALPNNAVTNLNYIRFDSHRNLTDSVTTVLYPVIATAGNGCKSDTTRLEFKYFPEPKAERLLNDTICSGEPYILNLLGYYGESLPGLVHNPDIRFSIGIRGQSGLVEGDSIDLDGAECVTPFGSMDSSAIQAERWVNPYDFPVTITYSILPYTRCGETEFCAGEEISFNLTVEPEPRMKVFLTLNGEENSVADGDFYTACSEAQFAVTAAGAGVTPSGFPGDRIWAQVRIWGDVDALGFPGSLTASDPIEFHGPLEALNFSADSIENTTSQIKYIYVTAIPYIESTPVLEEQQILDIFECSGEPISFEIRINPEAAHSNVDLAVCSDESLGWILEPDNNPGQGVQVQEREEYTDPARVHKWVVPLGVDFVQIDARGADGGNGGAKGGEGANVSAIFPVSMGDTLEIALGVVGGGTNGFNAGGGGGATAVLGLGDLLVVAAGGGGGGALPGGGGQTDVAFDTGGLGGAASGGGGGGGFLDGTSGLDGGGSGGEGGDAGFGAMGGPGNGGGADGGNGSGAGGGGGANGGGGGGGFFGGDGGSGVFGAGGNGGSSYVNTNLAEDDSPILETGRSGFGTGQNGLVRLSWIRTLPPVTYTITSIEYDPSVLMDADSIDRSVAPNNVGVANFSYVSDLIASEKWINPTDTFQTVVYTINPDTDSNCESDPFIVTVKVEPDPETSLEGPGLERVSPNYYTLTLCSMDTMMVDMLSPTLPSGGPESLKFELQSVEEVYGSTVGFFLREGVESFPDLSGLITPQPIGTGSDLPIGLRQWFINTDSVPATVTYILRTAIEDDVFGICGEVFDTLVVTIFPEPAPEEIFFIYDPICSFASIGSVFDSIRITTFNGIPIVSYEVIDVLPGTPDVVPVQGPTMGVNADFTMDSWNNQAFFDELVTYRVVLNSADGCSSFPVDYLFFISPNPRLNAPDTMAVCNNGRPSLILDVFRDTLSMEPSDVTFQIVHDNPAGLTYTGFNDYDPDTHTVLCADEFALFNDTWENAGNTAVAVTYTITPIRFCGTDQECAGEPHTLTVFVEPDISIFLQMNHSGTPEGPDFINEQTSPPGDPLSVTLCADTPIEVSLDSFSMVAPGAELWALVTVYDTGRLINPNGFIDTVLKVAELSEFLTFPNGISNNGTTPSEIEIVILPFSNRNQVEGDPIFIDFDECTGLVGIVYDLIIESPVVANVDVVLNPAPATEVCNDENFTLRMRKTTNSVPISAYRVWVETGANVTQDTAAAISTDSLDPTVFDMVGTLATLNIATFTSRLSNASTLRDSVVYHIIPVSTNGCIGQETRRVVYVYGKLQVDIEPRGVCLRDTATIFSNPEGGSGDFLYTWTYRGGTARNFRINGQLFGASPIVGTVIANPSDSLVVNANELSAGVTLITLPGTFVLDLLLVDNLQGCSLTLRDTLEVVPGARSGSTISNVPVICEGDDGFDLFGQLAMGSYDTTGVWTQTGGPDEGELTPDGIFTPSNITGIAQQMFEFTYTVDNGICPPASTAVTIQVQPIPRAGVATGETPNLCVGAGTFNLFDLITPDTYDLGGNWSQIQGTTSLAVSPSGTVSLGSAAAGSYIFRYSFAGSGACGGSEVFVSLLLESNANAGEPVPGADLSFCNRQDTVLLFSLIRQFQEGGTWTRLGTVGPQPDPTTGLLLVDGTAPGLYTYRYTVTGQAPCTGTDNVDVTITIEPPLPLNPIVGFVTVCEDSLASYTLANLQPGSTYSWSLANGGTINSPTDGDTISVLWDKVGGPFILTVVEVNEDCDQTNTLEVTVEPSTAADFSSEAPVGVGLTLNFTDETVGSPTAWQWTFGDGETSEEQNPTHTYAAAGTYEVCLTATGPCGEDTLCQNVVVTDTICDNISLRAGLNLISTDVIPADNSIAAVFEDLLESDNILFIQGRNSSGGVVNFDPNLPPFLNTLNQIRPGEGYYLRVVAASTLTICGTPIDTSFRKNLNAGINLVAYLPQASSTPSVYFSDLLADSVLLLARGFNNGYKIFDPSLPPFLNSLTSVANGFGYEIRVTTAVMGNDWLLSENQTTDFRSLNGQPANSMNYDVIVGRSNLPISAIGKQVELVNSGGEILGVMDIVQDGYLFTTPVYGFDPAAESASKLRPGDKILFRYGTSTVDIGLVFHGDKRINFVEVEFPKTIFAEDSGTDAAYLDANPNPFSDELEIVLQINAEMRASVVLFNAFGQVVEILQPESTWGIGQYRITRENRPLPSGTYFIAFVKDGVPMMVKTVVRR